MADTDVVSYEDGVIKILSAGQTTFDVVFENNELETYDVIVMDDTIVTDAEDTAANVTREQPADNSKRNIFIIIAVAVALVVLVVEYLVIMKPVSKRSKKLAEAEAFFENESREDGGEEDEEMRAELQKAFAVRDARRKAAQGDESDEQQEDAEVGEDTDKE